MPTRLSRKGQEGQQSGDCVSLQHYLQEPEWWESTRGRPGVRVMQERVVPEPQYSQPRVAFQWHVDHFKRDHEVKEIMYHLQVQLKLEVLTKNGRVC